MVISLIASCSIDNTKEDPSLEKYFTANRVSGCFAMFDNGTGQFTVYNMNRYRDSAYLPASTFKIVNSLIGLETGIVRDSSTIIPWDSVKRKGPNCNQDLTMQDAFRFSCVPWYQELARRIGKDRMQHWIDTIGYARSRGNPVITNNLDTFWLDNSVKVTGDEQLGLVKKLYFDQLPFQPRSQRIVRSMMKQEENANYRLSYKTGMGFTEEGHALGWMIGFIEENNHPYFFVLQLESPEHDYDMAPVRMSMLKQILKQYGFLEGKR